MKINKYDKLTYITKFPENFDAQGKYPIIFLMHGAGGRGNDVDVLKTNPYFRHIKNYDNFPFISVAPLCSENTWFDLFENLKDFIKHICESVYVDKERVYMIGASMGGYAVWQLAMSMPDVFAAIVPICGGGMYWNAERLKNIPIWAFHGANDKIVYPDESQKMVDHVNLNGGNAKLTIYPNCEHSAWNDTYSNYEVFEWMLSHTNRKLTDYDDKYKDSEIYG